MQLQKVDFVSIPTRDLERASSFYGACNMAFIRDPDGNGLMLHHPYKPHHDGPTP